MSDDPFQIDTRRRFVRVSGQRANGFIEFEFAIGEPEIFIEMILGCDAFKEFCTANEVEMLPPRDPDAPLGDWDWRLADATRTRFR
ncbi:MAG TPA: phenol hydroxylase subunit [Rhodocyclaceae bacterium]|nr:phenol hydroxylase [Zoogloeaceae bacterium]HRD34817.1 phenol hydroxylase subunit [Rhodocyclaceae bacterium]